jgi:hypothetical protein
MHGALLLFFCGGWVLRPWTHAAGSLPWENRLFTSTAAVWALRSLHSPWLNRKIANELVANYTNFFLPCTCKKYYIHSLSLVKKYKFPLSSHTVKLKKKTLQDQLFAQKQQVSYFAAAIFEGTKIINRLK